MNFYFQLWYKIFLTIIVSPESKNQISLWNYFWWDKPLCNLHIEGMPKNAISNKFPRSGKSFLSKTHGTIISRRPQSKTLYFYKGILLRNVGLCSVDQIPESPKKTEGATSIDSHRFWHSCFSVITGLNSLTMLKIEAFTIVQEDSI